MEEYFSNKINFVKYYPLNRSKELLRRALFSLFSVKMIVPKKKKKVIQEFLVNIRERERGGWGRRCVYIHTRAMADGDLKIFSCY